MNHTMQVRNRGAVKFNRILVYNWYTSREVDMVKDNGEVIVAELNCVAIFKIKWKKIVL